MVKFSAAPLFQFELDNVLFKFNVNVPQAELLLQFPPTWALSHSISQKIKGR